MLRAKLNHLDNVLPLVFELKKAGIISNPLFIVSNIETFELIKRNTVLYDGIHFIDGKLAYINRFNNRYIRWFHNLFVLRELLYQGVMAIEILSNYSKLTSFMLAFNRKVLGGKRILAKLRWGPYEEEKIVRETYRIVRGKSNDPVNDPVEEEIIKGYDCVLLSHTQEQYEESNKLRLNADCKIFQVGYTRGLGEWEAFLKKREIQYFSKQIKPPYFFFVLGALDSLGPYVCPPVEEVLRECLQILKDYNDDILTVFKPHPTTNIGKFQNILRSMSYKNYTITNIHWSYLARNAKFTFTNHHSTLLSNAYFCGSPVVEYVQYDPRILKYTKGKSMAGDLVDYFIPRDKVQLREALDELIYNDFSVKRDSFRLKNDFPVLSLQDIKEKFSFLNIS